ncbi:Atg14 domain-containing protein [Flavobacterium sp. LS1R47]|uniref:Atg14 domain-containing protein n=1 Tax=Flavobacterium frigoritolerans TaxID=2987686 RepID=A0A9X2ZII2_9FLAO|nr:Atg14 domain-containing protein [Flavobacterium frigoritolerans]MCV9932056.1 Atg14 domain-containing protein [Flavobacterium frigoritolerans]
MKKILLLVALLVIGSIQAQEKISSKKKKFYIPVIKYSEFPVLDNALTQTTFYQMDKQLIQEEPILKKHYFNIEGFIKDPANGKLKIYLTVELPQYKATKIDSTFDKEKNGWMFQAFSNYSVKIKMEAKCADKLLLTQDFNTVESYLLAFGSKKDNLRAAIEINNKKIEEAEKDGNFTVAELGLDRVIYSSVESIQRYLNYKLRYKTGEDKIKFEFVTSKGHSEYNQILAFENEITAQMAKVTLEKGLDEKLLTPHLQYLESLLVKYPPSPANENIRFIVTNNLAETYFLLENKEKTLMYANLLIENDKQDSRGASIVKSVNNAYFADKKIRSHTTRFADLKKLGLKIAEEKEEKRLAFFEKIEQQDAAWEIEKLNRETYLEKAKMQRFNLLDSIPYQLNANLLAKVVDNLGGSQALKKIEKAHFFSKLSIEGNNIPQTEEKWATTSNYLLKKKMPETYYEIVNGAEAWSHDDRERGVNAKWAKLSTYDYSNLAKNVDLINFLTDLRLDLWNNFEVLQDEMYEGRLCYHLNYFEKTLSTGNRTIPKTDYHVFIDKENFNIVSTEKTEFDNGNKSFFERRLYGDYRPVAALNSGKIPYKINYEIEDFNGETLYQEVREKVEINPVFGNRIFMKEVYFGGFK